jgi:protein involved in polysaccharide export with SLBB domain
MFVKLKVIIVTLLATLLLAASGFSQNVPVEESYKIKPEDSVLIRVDNVEECSGEFIVGLDGRFTMPYAGSLYVVGLTTVELEKLVTASLKKTVKDPKVTINLKGVAMDRVYMMGAIKEQGPIGWRPGWRVTEAIASAGGLTGAPERTKFVLYRVGSSHISVNLRKLLIDGDDSENIKILPGDVIDIQTDVTVRIQVVGEIKKAGIIEVLEGQGIAEAVAAAGGQTELSRLTGAKLMRHGQEVPIDLYGAIIKAQPELDTPVKENDTLFIPTLLTRISVIGQVGKPGPIGIQDGRVETLTDAISLAGGFTSRAKRDGVTVYSKDKTGKSSSKNYDVGKMFKSKSLKGDVVLNDGDIVYVAESGKPSEADLGVVFGAINMVRFFIP